LELVVAEMRTWSLKLRHSGPSSAQSEEEKAIYSLAEECQILSGKILDLIEKTKPKNQKSRIEVFWAAIRDKRLENDRLQLEKRLDTCRSQLMLQFAALDRFQPSTLSHQVEINE
jgi:hypothetical protein